MHLSRTIIDKIGINTKKNSYGLPSDRCNHAKTGESHSFNPSQHSAVGSLAILCSRPKTDSDRYLV
jgi:hypothetical protein